MAIRQAKVGDNWKAVYKANPTFLLDEIKLNGVLGINETINIKKNIYAICGRNGVGKSTILAVLKDVLGMDLTNREKIKIGSNKVSVQITCEMQQHLLQNEEGRRFNDLNLQNFDVNLIDYEKLIEVITFLEQEHLNELLEQFEEITYTQKQREELGYLIGKEYTEISIIIIEDEDKLYPYFKVKSAEIEYDSLTMGTGEHFLFFSYWILNNFTKPGILILEEPEVFISVPSEINLMNYIAFKMKEFKFNVLLVTHSPFVLQNINLDNILVLSQSGNCVSAFSVDYKEEYLLELGVPVVKLGSILFEDQLALEFFNALCKELKLNYNKLFNLVKMNGHGEISNVLSSPKLDKMDYKIIGIYDGDMRNSPDVKQASLNYDYYFLPGENNLESDFKHLLRGENVDYIASNLHIDKINLQRVIGRITGFEKHDWFNTLIKELDFPMTTVVRAFTKLWIREYEEEVKAFLEQFN